MYLLIILLNILLFCFYYFKPFSENFFHSFSFCSIRLKKKIVLELRRLSLWVSSTGNSSSRNLFSYHVFAALAGSGPVLIRSPDSIQSERNPLRSSLPTSLMTKANLASTSWPSVTSPLERLFPRNVTSEDLWKRHFLFSNWKLFSPSLPRGTFCSEQMTHWHRPELGSTPVIKKNIIRYKGSNTHSSHHTLKMFFFY